MRTTPRPKIARCMTSAIAIPSANSIETEITVMKTVLKTSVHHRLRGEHVDVVVEPDPAALVGEPQIDALEAEHQRVDDRVGGDQQHRDHRRRAEHPAELALRLGALADRLLAAPGFAGRRRERSPLPSEQPLHLQRGLDLVAQLLGGRRRVIGVDVGDRVDDALDRQREVLVGRASPAAAPPP